MNPNHTMPRDPTGNPHLEAIELGDVRGSTGFADEQPTQDADAFDHVDDEMSEREIDAMWVADMERRDREARERNPAPAGWRKCSCDGCGKPMLARVETTGTILCMDCDPALYADDSDDTDPTPPAGAAALPPGTIMRDAFACYPDDLLVQAVDVIDRGKVERITEAQRMELLNAATAEVLRRLGEPACAAA